MTDLGATCFRRSLQVCLTVANVLTTKNSRTLVLLDILLAVARLKFMLLAIREVRLASRRKEGGKRTLVARTGAPQFELSVCHRTRAYSLMVKTFRALGWMPLWWFQTVLDVIAAGVGLDRSSLIGRSSAQPLPNWSNGGREEDICELGGNSGPAHADDGHPASLWSAAGRR